jgi:hypothetical protein
MRFSDGLIGSKLPLFQHNRKQGYTDLMEGNA